MSLLNIVCILIYIYIYTVIVELYTKTWYGQQYVPKSSKKHEFPGVFLSVTVREEAKHTPGVADLSQELHRENHGHFHQTKIES